jgi:hypothetical protein
MKTKRAIDIKKELAIEEIATYKQSAEAMGETLEDCFSRVIWDLVWNGSDGYKNIDDELLARIYENETGDKIKIANPTTEEIEFKNKRYELAKQEYETMDASEAIDLLLKFIYNKMNDSAVIKLHDEIFNYEDNKDITL